MGLTSHPDHQYIETVFVKLVILLLIVAYIFISEWLTNSPNTESDDLWCTVCKCQVKDKKYNAEMHAKSKKHKQLSEQLALTPSVATHFTSASKTMKIFDIRWSVGIACHSAIRATDHLGEIVQNSSSKNDFLHNLKIHRTKCTSILTNVIHPCLLQNIIKDIQRTPFSLIIDESTDVSVSKHLCMCVKYFNDNSATIDTQFLSLIPVSSTTSLSLFSEIQAFFDEHNVPLSNIVGLGTDGASNLCGVNNSVFTKIKDFSPYCKLVKCICHSLSLCAKYAFSELPSNLGFLLSEISKWFKFTSERRGDYEQLFHVMNSNLPNLHPSKFVTPSDTRWLVTGKVIFSILTQWHELVAYFRSVNYLKSYASRLVLEMLNERSNLLYLTFALPLVNEFEQMNVLFQHTNANQCQLFDDLNTFYRSLRSRVCKPEFVNRHEQIDDSHVKDLKDIQFGAKFYQELNQSNLSQEKVHDIKVRCLKFLITAVNQVAKRFPESLGFYSTLKSFHPATLLSQTKYVRFSDLNLEDFDSRNVDLDKIESQYMNIRIIDWRAYDVDLNDMNAFWCYIYNHTNAIGSPCFRDLASLVLSALALPISNAFVERMFSHVTIVKSKLRNKISCDLLNSILMIKSHLITNNSCCRNFTVTEDMLQKFNVSMYNKPQDQTQEEQVEGILDHLDMDDDNFML